MKTFLVANAKSRRGRDWYERALTELGERGVTVDQARLVKEPQLVAPMIRDALQEGCQRILVGGGDGTLSAAAAVLADQDAILGVLPMGTGNAFARDLGIKTDPTFAVEVIAGGNTMMVDLGELDGQVFLNVATVGLSSLVALGLNPLAKKYMGPAAYLAPVLSAVKAIRPFKCELEVDDEKRTFYAYQVVVGNGRFHAGPFLLSERAGLDDGELVVYAVTNQHPQALIRYALALLRHKHVDLPEVLVWHAREGRLRTTPAKRVVIDGEVRDHTPMEFKLHRRALQVYVPNSA